MSHATDYVRTLEAELRALDAISHTLDAYALPLLTTEQRELVADLLDASGLEPGDVESLDAVGAWLDAYALEITERGKRALGSGEWTTDAVTVLRTFGGPNARVTVERGGPYVRISVVWGSDAVEGSVHAPQVAGRLWDLVDAYA